MCLCVLRKEVIITEGSRGSGESGVFEQRGESSPVVQRCKRVDTSEEMKAATVKKKGRQTVNLREERISDKHVGLHIKGTFRFLHSCN